MIPASILFLLQAAPPPLPSPAPPSMLRTVAVAVVCLTIAAVATWWKLKRRTVATRVSRDDLKRFVMPSTGSGKDVIESVAMDGIEVRARLSIYLRPRRRPPANAVPVIQLLVDIVVKLIEHIGACATHQQALASRQEFVDRMRQLKLDARTSYELVDIEFPLWERGRDIAAMLKT
jgi:uncharacterized protein YqfA (UPF0365 family)